MSAEGGFGSGASCQPHVFKFDRDIREAGRGHDRG